MNVGSQSSQNDSVDALLMASKGWHAVTSGEPPETDWDRFDLTGHANCRSDVAPMAAGSPDPASRETCPECDASFSKQHKNAVEGDDGALFCSIGCLNENLGP